MSKSDPVDYRVVTHARDSFNRSKADAIDVEFQAVFFDFWCIAWQHVSFAKLTATTATKIALFAIASSVFNSLVSLTVWTLPHSSIVQRPKF